MSSKTRSFLKRWRRRWAVRFRRLPVGTTITEEEAKKKVFNESSFLIWNFCPNTRKTKPQVLLIHVQTIPLGTIFCFRIGPNLGPLSGPKSAPKSDPRTGPPGGSSFCPAAESIHRVTPKMGSRLGSKKVRSFFNNYLFFFAGCNLFPMGQLDGAECPGGKKSSVH